ncbi:MAG TPA: COX15/CtaA family protein [Verrucomicrobiae bacterium]|nr:COX15/CtaA family protein [Verrucomicrobiae bacterium]
MREAESRHYPLTLFLAACVFFLLLAGGLVTSHEAGLAVPDWPLSYGRFMPPMVGNIFWEHGHRMIAGFVALLTLTTAVTVQLREERPWLRKLAWIAFGMVILQAVLGGITVLLLLPPAVSISHACLGQTFFCAVTLLAYYSSPFASDRKEERTPESRRLSRLALMTFGFLYLQLILGATVRHTGHAAPFHIANAFLVVVHVALLLVRVMRFHADRKDLAGPAVAMGVLTAVQFFLGMGSFIFKFMLEKNYAPSAAQVAFTSAHQITGALILGLCALVCAAAFPVPGARARGERQEAGSLNKVMS